MEDLPGMVKQANQTEATGEERECGWGGCCGQEATNLADRKCGAMDVEICIASIQPCEQHGKSCRCSPTVVGYEDWIVTAEHSHVEGVIISSCCHIQRKVGEGGYCRCHASSSSARERSTAMDMRGRIEGNKAAEAHDDVHRIQNGIDGNRRRAD